MSINWPEYFSREREFKKLAINAGIPNARAVAERMACHPPDARTAALILRVAAERAGVTLQPLVCTDATIVAAHRHLVDLEPTAAPSLNAITVNTLPEGIYGRCARGVIEIDPTSPFFKAAQAGDLLPLAALLVHEEHHARHGPAEAPAYAAHLAFLEKHNAAPALIDVVRASLHELEEDK